MPTMVTLIPELQLGQSVVMATDGFPEPRTPVRNVVVVL